MPVTFTGTFVHGFQEALEANVYELQAYSNPNVDWTWRFSALAGGTGVGVHVSIPPEPRWPGIKQFDNNLPMDIERARQKLGKWFADVHSPLRQELTADQVTLMWSIDVKAQAVLESGEAWRDKIVLFTVDGNLSSDEEKLVDERLGYWERRVIERNGRARG